MNFHRMLVTCLLKARKVVFCAIQPAKGLVFAHTSTGFVQIYYRKDMWRIDPDLLPLDEDDSLEACPKIGVLYGMEDGMGRRFSGFDAAMSFLDQHMGNSSGITRLPIARRLNLNNERYGVPNHYGR